MKILIKHLNKTVNIIDPPTINEVRTLIDKFYDEIEELLPYRFIHKYCFNTILPVSKMRKLVGLDSCTDGEMIKVGIVFYLMNHTSSPLSQANEEVMNIFKCNGDFEKQYFIDVTKFEKKNNLDRLNGEYGSVIWQFISKAKGIKETWQLHNPYYGRSWGY